MYSIILSVFMFFGTLYACSSSQKNANLKTGFISNDIYRVRGIGKFRDHLRDKPLKYQIYKCGFAAEMHAQMKIILELSEYGLNSVRAQVKVVKKVKGLDKYIHRTFAGQIRNGHVVLNGPLPGNNGCYVIYQIEEKDLKLKLKRRVLAYLKQKKYIM